VLLVALLSWAAHLAYRMSHAAHVSRPHLHALIPAPAVACALTGLKSVYCGFVPRAEAFNGARFIFQPSSAQRIYRGLFYIAHACPACAMIQPLSHAIALNDPGSFGFMPFV